MNPDLFLSILGLVPPFITVMTVLFTYVKSRTSVVTTSINSPRLRVLHVYHVPVDEKIWTKRLIKLYFLYFLPTILMIVFIAIFFIYIKIRPTKNFPILSFDIHSVLNLGNDIYTIIAGISFFIVITLAFNLIFSLPKSATDARYFLFKEIKIIIESDQQYLFNRCHETLRNMKLTIVEIDEKKGKIEAMQIRLWSIVAVIQVQIQKTEPSASIYSIGISFEPYGENAKEKFVWRSKRTNHFLNLLISKPKDEDIKASSKVEMSNGEAG